MEMLVANRAHLYLYIILILYHYYHKLNFRFLVVLKQTRQFELKLLEVDDGITSIPEQSYEVSATVPSLEFLKICRELKDIGGDTITVRVDHPDRITFHVEGDLGRGTAVMKEGVSIEVACETATSSYSLRYLATFAKGATLCPKVQVRMGRETPLRLIYFVDAELPEHGKLDFFLAPRICD